MTHGSCPAFLRASIALAVRIESVLSEFEPPPETDGHEISPELVGLDPSQRILGYSVRLDGPALHLHKKTRGQSTRLAKGKAAQYIKDERWADAFRGLEGAS
jgi:hypothetical protein